MRIKEVVSRQSIGTFIVAIACRATNDQRLTDLVFIIGKRGMVGQTLASRLSLLKSLFLQ